MICPARRLNQLPRAANRENADPALCWRAAATWSQPSHEKTTHICRHPCVISRFLVARTPLRRQFGHGLHPVALTLAGRRALETPRLPLTNLLLAPKVERLKPANVSRHRARHLERNCCPQHVHPQRKFPPVCPPLN